MALGKNRARMRVDTWHDVGHTSNLNQVGTKEELGEKKSTFFPAGSREEERRREKEDSQGFLS